MIKEQENGNRQIIWIELLRILACFLVIVNHTNSKVFLNAQPSLGWFVSLTYFFFSKIAVPLFVMISGYLLLDREDTYVKNFQRIIRIVAALFIGTLFYYLYFIYLGKVEKFQIANFLETVIKAPVSSAYWYLYMYLGLLVMLPFLQKMVKQMTKKDFHVFFVCSLLIGGIWPILVHYEPKLLITKEFDVPLFSGYIAMLLLGCYMKKYVSVLPKQRWIALIILGITIFLMVIATYVEYTFVSQDKDVFLFLDDRTLFPIVLSAACVFYILKDWQFGKCLGKIIATIASCSFGIFLIADYLIEISGSLYNRLCVYVSPLVAVIAQEVWVFLCGFVIIFLMRLIPGMKKVI